MSCEYGWTDDQIGELTLRRLQQITAAIAQRYLLDKYQKQAWISWLAQAHATAVSATVPAGKGKGNPLDSFIRSLDLNADSTGEDKPVPKAEPAVGSTERLLTGFRTSMSG